MTAALRSLILCTSILVGCTSERLSLNRGDRLRVVEVDRRVKNTTTAHISGADVAYARVKQRVCVDDSHEYQVTETLQNRFPSWRYVIVGLAFAGAGFGAAAAAKPLLQPGVVQDILTYGGAAVGSVGVVALLIGLISRDQEVVTEPTEDIEKKLVTECTDSPVTSPRMKWRLSAQSLTREGQLQEGAKLDLRPMLFEMLAASPTTETAAKKVLLEGMRYDLRLGDAPEVTATLEEQVVPAATWNKWATAFAANMDRRGLLRWDSCLALDLDSARNHLECFAVPERFSKRLLPVTGNLDRTVEGYYGALNEFTVDGAQPFSYQLSLPRVDADWLVRMVEVETGRVIAENFTSQSARHQLAGFFPAKGTYAVVHSGRASGSYQALLSLSAREVRRPDSRAIELGLPLHAALSPVGHTYVDGRYFDRYTHAFAPGARYSVQLSSYECAPELFVRDMASPALLPKVTGPVEEPLGLKQSVSTFSVPSNGGRYWLEVSTPKGQVSRCKYEIVARSEP